jgi:imidazolonepropionase-like amidohydrolase
MGSDAVFTGFGENTRELTWLVQGGMSPVEALAAATINGAASIGVDHEIGKVAVGYYADIIAVEGDPLTDINAVINGVRGVMKGGQLVSLE